MIPDVTTGPPQFTETPKCGKTACSAARSIAARNATVLLPAEWRSKLEVVGKLGQGTFGVVFKCKVLCEQHANIYVSVKLITKKDRHVLEEIRVLEQMRGVSDFCISAIGSPSFVDNSDGYWIMTLVVNSQRVSGKCASQVI